MSKPRKSYPGGCSRRPGDLNYCGPNKPRLSELGDEARRVLAAEALGWKLWQELINHGGERLWMHPDHRTYSSMDEYFKVMKFAHSESHLPNPDQDVNDALKLVEHAREMVEHWGFEACLTETGCWEVWFTHHSLDAFSAVALTLPRAITSCFLLAKGLATE